MAVPAATTGPDRANHARSQRSNCGSGLAKRSRVTGSLFSCMQDVLDEFHPLVAGWFRERFGAPTEPQRAGWPKIRAHQDVLIAAPTGSGKTLAAFLACMDELVRGGLVQRLGDHTAILYVSPLKALSNDVHRNLEAPLA